MRYSQEKWVFLVCAIFVFAVCWATQGWAQGPIRVEVVETEDGWGLRRDGKPYHIQGAGGMGSLEMLAACGGNSNRTWGVDASTRQRLDEAHRNGITVAVGIWLEHERHGFDYSDETLVQKQFDKVLEAVEELKDHPAVLLWGVGNEMEGYESGDDPRIWSHVENLCREIKKRDPHHPVMSVVAEIKASKIKAINELCPSLDLVGINSYAGAASLPERYRELGGKKPYVVTEFGPRGTWEVGKNNIDAIEEPTSSEKAKTYRETLESLQSDPMCVGSYAFLWGDKQEATPTWFGLLMPSGKKTNAVDTLVEIWTGKPPEFPCPVIEKLEIVGGNTVAGGDRVKFVLKSSDPKYRTCSFDWVLRADAQQYITGGDKQAEPPVFKGAVKMSGPDGAEVVMPTLGGLYRLYVYVDNGKGVATANVPLLVSGKDLENPGGGAKLPYVVYDEATAPSVYAPSGFMGDAPSIKVDLESTDQPKFGKTCASCTFSSPDNWGGVVWQNPENDWGDQPGGLDLDGARKLTFWVRGAKGGETVKFGFGLIPRNKEFYDTAKKEMEVRLETEWKQVVIDVAGMDLRRIKSGFYWVVGAHGEPVQFFLDRIRFEGDTKTAQPEMESSAEATAESPAGANKNLPYVLYEEATVAGEFVPSGWMGDTTAIKLVTDDTNSPRAGNQCIRCEFDAKGWGGVVWQSPENDWGDKPGGVNLQGAKELMFWARGERGGETVKFGFGLIGKDKPYFDTAKKEQEFQLTADWKPYSISLEGLDLTRIKTGFSWVVADPSQPVKFYLDSIRYK